MTILLVAIGSALGGVSRYWLSFLLSGALGDRALPWGSFSVNVLGSLAIGVLSGWLAHSTGNVAAIRAFAVVGFCGGFTTFSTFSNESFRMLENGQFGIMSLYVFGAVAAGLAAVWIGYLISKL